MQLKVAHSIAALPEHWASRMAGRPIVADGDPLDPRVQLIFKLQARAARRSLEDMGPQRARREYRRLSQVLAHAEPRPAGVEELSIEGVPVRIYRPTLDPSPRAGVVYLHGGGFVIGDLDTHDPLCRILCQVTGAIIVAVDYRLAPEHAWPAGIEDGEAVTRWVMEHGPELGIDPTRVALCGDSAGGQIAAVVSQRVPNLRYQALFFPPADALSETDSKRLFAKGFGLDATTRNWFRDCIDTDLAHETVSPARSTTLDRSPPTYFALAGFDPLRDEGRQYARALERAGVQVTVREHSTLVHAFVHMTRIEPARAACVELARALERALR